MYFKSIQIRTFWNTAVDEVTLAIGQDAGCPNAFWGVCGTVSAFSDVDTAIIGKSLSPSDANIYIIARNAVHTCALGGHSGIQLDTEPYIPHSAKYNTLGSLSGAPQAHAQYIACQKDNDAHQYYGSCNKMTFEMDPLHLRCDKTSVSDSSTPLWPYPSCRVSKRGVIH